MKPLIIDNLLPKPVEQSIFDMVTGSSFPWTHHRYSVSSKDLSQHFYTNEPVKDHTQFRHGFARHDEVTSEYYKYIQLLSLGFEGRTGLQTKGKYRIKANLLVKQDGPVLQPPHVDCMDMLDGNTDCLNYKTLLYYINDSDGDTIFYNEYFTGEPVGLVTEQQRVSPKRGRAVIFDSNQIHSGSCPSINNTRIVINCVFVI